MYVGTNPSALRSQEAISVALLELLTSRAISDISVSEICRLAQVSRQTFYKLFNGKDDVLQYEATHRCTGFEETLRSYDVISLERFAELIFIFFQRQADFVRLLLDNNLLHLVQDQADAMFARVLEDFSLDASFDDTPANRTFISSGICGMLVYQIRNGFEIDAQAKALANLLTIGSFRRNR